MELREKITEIRLLEAEIKRLKEVLMLRTIALQTACGCAQEEKLPGDALLNNWRQALGWDAL